MALLSICCMTFSKSFSQGISFQIWAKAKIIDLQKLREEIVSFLRNIMQFISVTFREYGQVSGK